MCRGDNVESEEKKWEKFRDVVKECTNDVCGRAEKTGEDNGRMKKLDWRWPKRESIRGMAAEKRLGDI